MTVPLVAQGGDSCTSPTQILGLGQFFFDTTSASGPDADPGCGSIAADVWFEWTAPLSGTLEIDSCGANYDSVLAVWQGAGCPSQVLACNDDTCGLQSRVTVPVTGGNTYMLQIGGWSGASGSGMLSLTLLTPPANDNCSNAELISGAGVFPYDSTFATTDGPLETGCTSGSGAVDHDVWFLWSAPWSGLTTLSTCNQASFDTQLVLYPWTGCPTGGSMACNDDFCGLQSTVTFDSVVGTSYLIRAGSFAGSVGGFGSLVINEGGPTGGCSAPPPGPDIIVGNVVDTLQWGTVGGITGYSIGATACNIGDSTLPWEGPTNHHPVIAQHLYRLKDGGFEQLGMSWVKHGFASATENFCCTCVPPGSGQVMGIGCADTYGASTNGVQEGFGTVGGLGPRSEVNPITGEFPFPYTTQGMAGDAIYKRLQVANADLDPNLNLGASYFVEVIYINPDDASAGHQNNNASWRPAVQGLFTNGGWGIQLTDVTRATEPVIFAWREMDPQVVIETVDVPDDGRFFVGSRATDNGNGTWHYEIAVQNYNSLRSADGVRLLLAPGTVVSNAEFHGVNHHSGEPYDTQDWSFTTQPDSIQWEVTPPLGLPALPEPNALRWGTTFTFRFDANAPPANATLDLSLLAPGIAGSPERMLVMAQLPDAGCDASIQCVTSVNSTGAAATIDFSGSISVSANDFTLLARNLPLQSFGLFYYGPGEARTVFGNGIRCVSPGSLGLFRLPIVNSGPTGIATHLLDITQPPQASGLISAGSTWHFQFWFRDAAAGGAEFNLSNSLRVTFCP